jgi:hypothetical protein
MLSPFRFCCCRREGHFCQQSGIEAYLQYRIAFRFARQLCIDYFIGPSPELARFLNATQNVRASDPLPGLESALCNNGRTRTHCIERFLNSIRINANTVNTRD